MSKQSLLSVIILLTSLQLNAQKKQVLFLGNSYTAVNNLPKMVADIALSTGDTLIFDSNTPGGYTLQGHSTNSTSLSKIMLGNWEYVILQEQSQLPSFGNNQVQQQVFPYARLLDSLINQYNPCAETMFYMTWGRKNGDASNCAAFPIVCTYNGMDSMLNLRYRMMADSNQAVVSPVGAVWKYIRQNFPLIELYQADESHPSLAGSYAAACCFYAAIFRKNPLLITDNYSLPATDADNIKAAAKAIVFDSLQNWHIGEYDPLADFSFNVNNNTVAFNNNSVNATSYQWTFGDGSTATVASPAHTYMNTGSYQVMLTATHCSTSHTITHTINVSSIAAISNIKQSQLINSYPNPADKFIRLKINKLLLNNAYSITDLNGKTLLTGIVNDLNIKIDIEHLPEGIFILKMGNNLPQKFSIIR